MLFNHDDLGASHTPSRLSTRSKTRACPFGCVQRESSTPKQFQKLNYTTRALDQTNQSKKGHQLIRKMKKKKKKKKNPKMMMMTVRATMIGRLKIT